MSYTTKEASNYRMSFADYVREEVRKQGWNLAVDKKQFFYADGVFVFDRKNMDCNNYWKVMLDAITDTQLVWADDNVVCERVQRVYYDPSNPRIELDIYPVEWVGIFEDAHQLDEFVANCSDCVKANRRCSLLAGAIEGRIQPEIKDFKCAKFKRKKGLKE